MRRLLLVVLFVLLAVPVIAEHPLPTGCIDTPVEVKPGKVVCNVARGWDKREVDVANNRVAPDHRRWKLSLGLLSSDRIRTHTPTNDFAENIGEGSFLRMFGSAVGTWLQEKDGRHIPGIGINSGNTASLTMLTNNPRAFGEGESFVLSGSRNPAEFSRSGAGAPLVEFRPRLGGWRSRWRIGTQLAFSDWQYGRVDAVVERINVTNVSVSPYSREFVGVNGTLGRSNHREEYRAYLSSWQVTIGPEFELAHGGPVDLSVETGYAYFHYDAEGMSDLYQAHYLVFAPELFVQDVEPSRLLEGGDTPLTARIKTSQGRHRLYAGLRADAFPFHDHLGINVGVRWYSGNLPFTQTFSPELFGPFDIRASAKHWVFSIGLTLAWTQNE